jgi:hypothetical protein
MSNIHAAGFWPSFILGTPGISCDRVNVNAFLFPAAPYPQNKIICVLQTYLEILYHVGGQRT